MKKIILFVFLVVIGVKLQSQIVDIPDPVFKQALLDHGFFTGIEIDTNFDGEIQVSEAEALTGILDVNGQFIDIYDLTGIEAFLNITELSVWLNQLTSLDLSSNTSLIRLQCTDNNLDYLNVSQCLELEILNCEINQLSDLNLTNNFNLKQLVLRNNSIVSLDLTNNINLQSVSCSDNSLEYLDIRSGQNTDIIGFTSENNPNLICIFVDDTEYSETNWFRDPASTFVETQSECDNLSVNENLLQHLSIYPHPVSTILTIDNNSIAQIKTIKIYDVLGRLVLQEKEQFNNIDVSQLTSGLLFVTIETKQGMVTKKVVKE